MDENHQDTTGSKTLVTNDTTWVLNKSKIWTPKHKKKTGFEDKTRWDWLQLLLQILGVIAIPLAIFLGTTYFSAQQNQISMQIADDQQQETTLKSYLDDMSDLLLNHGLRTAKSGDEVSQVARERTLTTLRRLKADRNKIVVQFLQDAHLIGTPNAVINFSNADLSGDDLRGARLGGVNLSGADLTNASLNDANLTQADLRDADLSNANLFHADLYDTNLSRAILRNATLTIAFLRDANLTNADLGSANLNGAYLGGANLNGAFLSNSDLSGISGLTQQQLDKVFFCKGATLPQGLVCHRTP